ncbi:immunoglobulin-like domain-containing protein [Mariniflexile soesokkakense]|uniref:Immunoglobulin-like domain-containing protein n=1 Tax=Mariniflexile soesokkakense TaxID=1343160 RepID=A0ABV0A8C5_9FLAO
MKNIYKVLLCITVLFLSSCDTETTGDVSRVTNYAVIEINGDSEVIINQGAAWTDPSATVTLAGEPYPFETSRVVDPNVPGVYYITYSAVNDEGYAATATRTVVVVSTATETCDLSGTWKRSNNSPGTMTRTGMRRYTYDNAGGVTGDNQLTVDVINVNDVLLYIPFKANASPSGLSVVSFQPGEITSCNNFSWSLSASGFYGNFVRTFSRT